MEHGNPTLVDSCFVHYFQPLLQICPVVKMSCSAIGQYIRLSDYFLLPGLHLLLPLHGNIPVVHSRRSNLQCLYPRMSAKISRNQVRALTVICSLKKSKSSSEFSSVCCAPYSFPSSSVSASAIGYASITFAPNHK